MSGTPSPRVHNFPGDALDPRHAQGRPLLAASPGSSPPYGSPRGITTGIARGDIGNGYGPYTYERSRASVGTTLSDVSKTLPLEKEGTLSNLPSVNRRMVTDSTAAAGMPVYMWHTSEPEEDDALHAPEDYGRKGRSARATQPFVLCSLRGWLNVGTLGLLLAALLGLFIGYPIVLHIVDKPTQTPGFNLGGINATGQVPDLPIKRLIDPMTPQDAMSRTGSDGKTYNLVFSDEFETDDRTFYPGDDPYWEAQDLHYWPTGDMEWYDPSTITTKNGKLVITLDQKDPINNHNLSYTSGMLTTWNKFCFTTGYIEARVSLPGSSDVPGLWPGIWTMGNLGRAGYGATTEGMWPYSYDSCDLGTFPRQMDKSGNPATSATDGWQGSFLSDQPGQRLSACTCPGSDHPGPKPSNGRAAPELDIIEAQIDLGTLTGEVSQSYQIAPFNAFVKFVNSSPETTIYDPSITTFNSFTGTALQQAISGVTKVSSDVYNDKAYTTYAFEYWSNMKNRDEGYVLWYSSGQPSWKITSASIGPDPVSQVDQRLIPEEPMYIILNLGLSTSFTRVDLDKLVFPSKMYIDYVRVYQREDVSEGVTCDPSHHPTADYIENHPDAYTNWNWTTWDQAGYQLPRNSKYDGC